MANKELEEKLILLVKTAHEDSERQFQSIYDLCGQVGQALIDDPSALSEGALADIGYLFRKMEEAYLQTKRECFHKHDQIGRILALVISKRGITGGKLVARGKIASASPEIKVGAKLPTKGSEKWHSLLAGFGVSQEARDKQLVGLYWPGLRDWLTNLEAQGYPVPEELRTVIKQYPTCSYRPLHTASKKKKDD